MQIQNPAFWTALGKSSWPLNIRIIHRAPEWAGLFHSLNTDWLLVLDEGNILKGHHSQCRAQRMERSAAHYELDDDDNNNNCKESRSNDIKSHLLMLRSLQLTKGEV